MGFSGYVTITGLYRSFWLNIYISFEVLSICWKTYEYKYIINIEISKISSNFLFNINILSLAALCLYICNVQHCLNTLYTIYHVYSIAVSAVYIVLLATIIRFGVSVGNGRFHELADLKSFLHWHTLMLQVFHVVNAG